MNGDAVADRVIDLLRASVVGTTQLAGALQVVEALVRSAVSAAVREVVIEAPGITIEDLRTDGGAIVEDLRTTGETLIPP